MKSIAIADHSVQFRNALELKLKLLHINVALSTSNGAPFIEELAKIPTPTVALINYLPVAPFTLNTAESVRDKFPGLKIVITATYFPQGVPQLLLKQGYDALWKKELDDIPTLISIIQLVKEGYRCFHGETM